MKKDELNYNLNKSPTNKGLVMGSGVAVILSTMPEIIAHPKSPCWILMLFSAGLGMEIWGRLKDQMKTNENLIKKHKIKDYQNPATWAANCGLFASETIAWLPSAITTHDLSSIFVVLLSAGFFIPSVKHLKNIIETNKNQIDKIR